MKRFTIILFCILRFLCTSVAQNETSEIIKRARWLVAADFTEFSSARNTDEHVDLTNSTKEMSEKILTTKGLSNCICIRMNINCRNSSYSAKNGSDSCSFYLAYDKEVKRFYKLGGFRQNEFYEFFNFSLLNGSVNFSDELNSIKKQTKYILKNVSIEGIDLNKYYERYYLHPKEALVDTSSCYRKSIIVEYKK